MFTRLYIKYYSKFFYLSTSQFKFHLNLVHDFHRTLNGEYMLQALRWFPSFSPFTLHYISWFFFFEAERTDRKCVECVTGAHNVCHCAWLQGMYYNVWLLTDLHNLNTGLLCCIPCYSKTFGEKNFLCIILFSYWSLFCLRPCFIMKSLN